MRSFRRALVFVCSAGASTAVAQVGCSSFSGDGSGTTETDAAVFPETPGADASDAAADVADAAADAHFCAAHADAALCADFDEGDPVNFHFTEIVGNVTIDDASAASAPASMRVVAASASAFLRSHVTPATFTNQQHLSFATYPGTLGGDGGLVNASYIGGIQQFTARNCSFDIEYFGDHARLVVLFALGDGGVTFENFDMTAYPPAGRWSRVEILLGGSGTTVIATVLIDGIVAVNNVSTSCPKLAPDPFLYVGFPTGKTGEAHYDNVLFEGK